jgi:shikimate dehydrogenase
LGAGGAARSIAFNLATEGVEKIVIFDHSLDCSREVAKQLNKRVESCATYLELNNKNLKKEINKCDVLVNATGMGMYPNLAQTPIDKKLFHDNLIVSDLIYNPLKTKFLKEAEEMGCKTLNGVGMFINQGAEAFKLWTGIEAPTEKMSKIVHKIIEEN